MRQIRLCRTANVCHLTHEIRQTAEWAFAAPSLRQDYEIMARTGNEVFGAGTHWIEERKAPHLRPTCSSRSEA
jgi:hypothetical protein